jgi:hypothetical protein
LLLKGYEPLFLVYPGCSKPHWQNHPGWSWNFELGQNLNIGWYSVFEIFGWREGGDVETGLFSSLLSVVNADYRILTWKVCARKWSWPVFVWQDWENHEKFQVNIQWCSWDWHRVPPGVLLHTILHRAIAQTVACIP